MRLRNPFKYNNNSIFIFSSGKLVDPSPELEKELKNDRERVCKQFGVKPGQDYTKFPSFTFKDPELESPGLPSPPK